MKKIIFRCWAWSESQGWKELETAAKLRVRNKPKWFPNYLWKFLLRKLFLLEAVLEVEDGYIDDESITVIEM